MSSYVVEFVLCVLSCIVFFFFFFFKQKTAYEMRISDWSSDVCSSDLSIAHQQMTANLDFVVGRYHERPFAVCEQTRMMASTLSDSVSSIVGSLSGNLGRKRRCLRAEAATVASAYM